MGMTIQDVSVRLAMDLRQLKQDGDHAESYISHLGDKMVSKFNRLIGVSLFHTALHLLTEAMKEVLPTAEEFWDRIYGNSKGKTEVFEELRKHLRGIREDLEKTTEHLNKFLYGHRYKHGSDEEKVSMLQEERDANLQAQRMARDEINRAGPGEYRAQAQSKLNKLIEEGFEIQDKLDDVQIKQADKKKEAAEKAQAAEIKAAKEVLKEHDRARAAELKHAQTVAAIKANLAGQDREFMPTLDELANSGQWMRTRFGSRKWWQPGRFAGAAQGIQDLEGDIKADVIEGRGIDPFKRDRLQSLRDQLSKAGVYQDPQHEANERLKELVDAATGKGINVIPQMEE